MKIYFHTLGCAKNLVESENLAGYIFKENKNTSFVSHPHDADFIILHTCSFIKPAIKESISTLRRLRKKSKHSRIIFSGCLAQIYKTKKFVLSESECRVVEDCSDFIVGAGELEKILEVLSGNFSKDEPILSSRGGGFHSAGFRVIPQGQPWAYLRVAEGCFHRCNYCLIPSIRGDYASRPLKDILLEARRLADGGVRELNLISQDTASYGKGLSLNSDDRHIGIVGLLKELEKIEGVRWLRLLYCYPSAISEDLIEYLATPSIKTLPYLDIPIQHISDRVLKLMGRPVTKKDIIRLIGRLRKKIKRLVLRTTFIVGHPGEKEEDFEDLLSFVKEGHFMWGGVFTYSKIPGTVSANLRGVDAISPQVASERRKALLEVIEKSSIDFFNINYKNKKVDSLVISRIGEKQIHLRPWFCAPDVDAYIECDISDKRRHSLKFSVGDIVKIRMTDYPISAGL